MPETVLDFEPDQRRMSLGVLKADAELKRVEDEIISVLRKGTIGMEEAVINAEIEGRNELKRVALRSLVKAGRIQRDGEGKKGAPYLYSIS